jgi:branched-chain amino acid transport system permease protein
LAARLALVGIVATGLDIITTAAILYGVAAGLLIVFGVMKIINFAHGGFLTVGGYSALLVTKLGLNPWWSIGVAFVIGSVCGMIIERVVVRPLYSRPLDAILATWGLGIIIGQVITLAFGREVQFVKSPVTGAVDVLGASYSEYRLLLVVVAVLLACGLALVMNATRLGLVTRAVIMNEDLARGLGINSGLVRFVTFSLGAGLASLAGALITPLSSVDPNMGVPWLVNAFMLVMVSGVSLLSLAVACLVLGGAQVLVSSWGNPILGGLTIVVLAAVVLRLRPQGFSRG